MLRAAEPAHDTTGIESTSGFAIRKVSTFASLHVVGCGAALTTNNVAYTALRLQILQIKSSRS